MFHQHPSSKSAYSLVIEHVFIEFVAGAMGHLVDDECVVIDMLLLVGNHTTIAGTFGTLA